MIGDRRSVVRCEKSGVSLEFLILLELEVRSVEGIIRAANAL